ncbi:FG-GAP-like repeat-containing protein, partial [Kitasatospora sp. NPDC093558]|uniref:FG-GAP-like repeat-containing protein n=1 Tax=Kitasatospora sp. NPDC093558 TaxID=3155201 RepID=UPI00341F935E
VRTGGAGRTATEWLPSAAHAGTAAVTATDATTVTLTPATGTVCRGDAGGPTFNATGAGVVVSSLHSLSGQAGCLAESSTTSQVTDVRVDDLASWITANTPRSPRTSSDFNGDGKTDIALTGGPDWTCLPVATSKGDGTFDTTCNSPRGGDWGNWAHTPNVKVVTGDFAGNGRTDLMLTGGAGWDCLPVAMAKGDGTFDVSCNKPGLDWSNWATRPGVKVITGDFAGNGRIDVALTGGPDWNCLPVAMSKGDGTFDYSCNAPGGDWGNWAHTDNVKVLTGDFAGNGRTSIALTGGAGWTCLPVLMSKGDGTFDESCNAPGGDWGNWAHTDNVKVVTGDFTGSGKTDIMLTGGAGWDCLPLLVSRGNGMFYESCNKPGLDWSNWAARPGVKVVTGDFNGDGKTDVVLTGGPDWNCLPMATAKGDGTFDYSCNAPGGYWGDWAHTDNVKVVAGDFAGNGRTDLMLTGGAGWDCLPVLMSKGDTTFDESCHASAPGWSGWASTPGVKVV